MKRRAMLTSAAGAAAAFVLAGYKPLSVTAAGARQEPAGPRLADLNPDRMWPVYRRYHLLIVGQRDDEQGLAFAAAVVDVLARFLPASRAMLVRAADARRIGVLIATDQQDVGVMTAGERRGVVSQQTALRGYPRPAAAGHCLVREPCSGVPAEFHGCATLI